MNNLKSIYIIKSEKILLTSTKINGKLKQPEKTDLPQTYQLFKL